MIQIGDFKLQSGSPKEYKNNYNRWSERLGPKTFKSVYRDFEEMENVFVYLMSGDSPICWWKGKITDFRDPNPQYKWLPMKNDAAIATVVNAHEAGMI